MLVASEITSPSRGYWSLSQETKHHSLSRLGVAKHSRHLPGVAFFLESLSTLSLFSSSFYPKSSVPCRCSIIFIECFQHRIIVPILLLYQGVIHPRLEVWLDGRSRSSAIEFVSKALNAAVSLSSYIYHIIVIRYSSQQCKCLITSAPVHVIYTTVIDSRSP